MADTVGKRSYLESAAWGFLKRAIFGQLKLKFEVSLGESAYLTPSVSPNIWNELGFAIQMFV